MVIDSSALIAVLCDEIEAPAIERAISADGTRLLSAANLLETSIVIEHRYGEAGGRELDLLIHKAGIDVIPVDADQIEIARACWRRFGKGRHRARLNFGDCFAYALARTSGERLLFKGDDFIHTDLASVTLDEQTL